MNRFVIVSFLNKDIPSVFRKQDWPLHVTVLAPFHSDRSKEELISALTSVSSQNNPIVSVGESQEMFGPKEDIPVIELGNTPELQSLHEQIEDKFSSLVQANAQQHYSFRPHVTNQKSGKIFVGEEVIIDSVSLVEMREDGRRVLHTEYF